LLSEVSWPFNNGRLGHLPEKDLEEFVKNTYETSARLLDFLVDANFNDHEKIEKKVLQTLNNWSSARNRYKKLPAPISVMKKWVKVAITKP
jgi:separase